MEDEEKLSAPLDWPETIRKIRERTPARIFVERGKAYSTPMQLELRAAHASAVDAVWTEFNLERDFSPEFIAEWKLFQMASCAESKSQFLLRPDLGRKLSDDAKKLLAQRCTKSPDLQIVIGDGLSGPAVAAQVPTLLPLLDRAAREKNWSIGTTFVVRHCRVGIMNGIGDLLTPRVLVLLVGERPGLATAESLSAYMSYQPRSGHTDAQRNLISNIHSRGIRPEEAATRIVQLAEQMMKACLSGTALNAAMPEIR